MTFDHPLAGACYQLKFPAAASLGSLALRPLLRAKAIMAMATTTTTIPQKKSGALSDARTTDALLLVYDNRTPQDTV